MVSWLLLFKSLRDQLCSGLVAALILARARAGVLSDQDR